MKFFHSELLLLDNSILPQIQTRMVWPTPKINQTRWKKSVGVYVCISVCVGFFLFSQTLHFIYNMIIFLFVLWHCLFTANLCVSVYLVWKIALNFYKGFPSYSMLQPLFILSLSPSLSLCMYIFVTLFSTEYTYNKKIFNRKPEKKKYENKKVSPFCARVVAVWARERKNNEQTWI